MTSQLPLRILCLDGGGVRGLSSLYIVKELMAQIRRKKESEGYQVLNDQLRPCDYFDLICGTGTGGLIAIMLGRLRYDIDTAIQEYTILSKVVFEAKSPDGLALFDATVLETEMRRVIQNSPEGCQENFMFKDLQIIEKRETCRTFVLASRPRGLGKEAIRMRSYTTDHHDAFQAQIWQVARATCAAPTYFLPIQINGTRYGDGRIGWNNPTMEAINEANYLWPDRPIACLISAGTGLEEAIQLGTESKIPSTSGVWGQLFGSLSPRETFELDVAQYCVSCVTSCERTHVQVVSNLGSFGIDGPWQYVRLNVPQGMAKIELQEWTKLDTIAAMTEDYMEGVEVRDLKERVSEILASSDYSSVPISAAASFPNRGPQGRIAYPASQRQIEARSNYAKNVKMPPSNPESGRSNALVRQEFLPSRQKTRYTQREHPDSSSDESGAGRPGQTKRSKLDMQSVQSRSPSAANLGNMRLPPVVKPLSSSVSMYQSQRSSGTVSSSDPVSHGRGDEPQMFSIYPESDILSTTVLCCDYPDCQSMGALQKGYLRDHYVNYHDEHLIKPSVMIFPADESTKLRSFRCSACLRKLTEENQGSPCQNCQRFDHREESIRMTFRGDVNSFQVASPIPLWPEVVDEQEKFPATSDISDLCPMEGMENVPSSQSSFWTPPEVPEHWTTHSTSSTGHINTNKYHAGARSSFSSPNPQVLPASIRKAREGMYQKLNQISNEVGMLEAEEDKHPHRIPAKTIVGI